MKRLNKYCAHVNLESCSIADAKRFLQDAIYEEINIQWKQHDGAHTCHAVQPVWKPLRWQRDMKSKLTCSWYHSVAVNRGRFKARYFDYGMVDSPACRFCGKANETIDHVLFCCPKLSETQGELQKACKTLDLEFNIQNLFTKPKLQRKVEEFLYEVFKDTINEPEPGNDSKEFSFF